MSIAVNVNIRSCKVLNVLSQHEFHFKSIELISKSPFSIPPSLSLKDIHCLDQRFPNFLDPRITEMVSIM